MEGRVEAMTYGHVRRPTGALRLGGLMRRTFLLTLSVVALILALAAVATPAFAAGFVNTNSWAANGSAPGQLAEGVGMAVANGQLYVCDYSNNRVQVFTTDGAYLRQWSVGSSPTGIAVNATTGTVYVGGIGGVVSMFGPAGDSLGALNTYGVGDGQTTFVYGLAVDAAGNIYVADLASDRIQVFSAAGAFLRKFGSTGTGDGQFDYASDVDVDSSGNIYVLDFSTQRVQKFASDGTFLTKWGSPGAGTGQFSNAMFMTIDARDHVFVSDRGNNRIQEFTASGAYLGSITAAGDTMPLGLTSGPHETLFGSRNGVGTKLFRWDYDGTAPVMSDDYDGEWHSTPFTVTFSATDEFTPVPWLRWTVNGGVEWTNSGSIPVAAAADHSNDGFFKPMIGAGDALSNWGYKTLKIKVDTRAPISSVSGVPAGWTNQEVDARISATDIGAGVAQTFYDLDGAGTTVLPDTGVVSITEPGQHTLSFWSQDACGDKPNEEARKSVQVLIDQSGPMAVPVNAVSVRHGAAATFKYTLIDDWSPTSTVKLVILKKGKAVKKVALGVKDSRLEVPPHAYSKKLTMGLSAGSYTWTVAATDLAGNAGSYAPKKLTIKP
jgi:DNA-binding beta-propeller fold protein YncE